MSQIWENGDKPSSGPDFSPFGPYSGCQFLFKNLAPSVTRYHDQLSSCTISEKTNNPGLRKRNDGWTDGQTEITAISCETLHKKEILL